MSNVKYHEDCLENQKPCSLKAFVDAQESFIIENTEYGEDPSQVWPLRFGQIAKELKVNVLKSSVDWGKIALTILRTTRNDRQEGSENDSQSGSSRKLLPVDRANIAKIYTSLDQERMWKLSTGTFVEKQMMKLAVECDYEHPCHSLILDPQCETWANYFTEQELKEIREHNARPIKQMPTSLQEYLLSYKGKHTLEELQKHHDNFKFDRITEPDHYWCYQTITKALDLYHYNYFQDTDRTEADFLRRLLEFGVCEAGKTSDSDSTKSIREIGMKCPKTMKDMLLQLAKHSQPTYGSYLHRGLL
ncbi:hypothetical protein EC973_006327 [Apophysomyces ossiformis]|uniref:Uncharacterized protein n=1 Tax=Apophysomyces ossiformis TaxID=679940 RepID=A0A8H7BZH1_9FUNG|nr:hypothetical protein EC973_006327 [Apophysomyces ossiformis]